MHVPFKIHYRNNLNDKKDSYLISCPPSWDDRNYSYGHQLYPSCNNVAPVTNLCLGRATTRSHSSQWSKKKVAVET